jgi:hypothetical protein
MGVLIAYSSSAHRNLDLLPSREVPDRTVSRAVLPSCCLRISYCLRCCPLDEPAQFRGVGRHRAFEGPVERPAADRQVETGKDGVQISSPAGQRTAMIGNTGVTVHHHTQQLALGRTLPAADAASLRACWGSRPTRHSSVYLPAPTSPLRVCRRTVVRFMPARDAAYARRPRRGPAGPRTGPATRSWGSVLWLSPAAQSCDSVLRLSPAAARCPGGCRSASR